LLSVAQQIEDRDDVVVLCRLLVSVFWIVLGLILRCFWIDFGLIQGGHSKYTQSCHVCMCALFFGYLFLTVFYRAEIIYLMTVVPLVPFIK
jgi:hypothetical protein